MFLELIIMGIIVLGVGLLNGAILAWILVDVTLECSFFFTVIILSSAYIEAIILQMHLDILDRCVPFRTQHRKWFIFVS